MGQPWSAETYLRFGFTVTLEARCKSFPYFLDMGQATMDLAFLNLRIEPVSFDLSPLIQHTNKGGAGELAPPVPALLNVHFNGFRTRFLVLCHVHTQHPILEVRAHLIGVCVLRQ